MSGKYISFYRRRVNISAYGWLLLVWICFVLFVHFLWFKIDHRPSRWDESSQLLASEYAYQHLKNFDIIGALKTDLISPTKPGFLPFLSGVSYLFVGNSTKVSVFLLNSISLIVVFVSTYLLGKTLFNKLTGLLACVLFISYHGIFLLSKYYMPDLPLAAIVSLTILLIVLIDKSEFQNKKLNVMLGLALAIGMSVKQIYVAFVFLPMAFLFFPAFFKKGEKTYAAVRQRWPFFGAVIIGILLGLAYQALNFGVLYEMAARMIDPASSAIAWYKPPSNLRYLQEFWSFQLGTELGDLYLALFMIGLVFSFFRFSKPLLFLYLWIVGIFVVLLSLHSKMPYYFHPVMPVFALISFSWVTFKPKFSNNKLNTSILAIKTLVIVLICIFAVGYFLEKNLGTRNVFKIITRSPAVILSADRMETNPFVVEPYWINTYVDGNVSTRPYPHYWYMDEMLDAVVTYTANVPTTGGTMFNVFVVGNYEWMSLDMLRYKIWQKGLNNKLQPAGIYAPISDPSQIDFVLIKTGRIAKNDFYDGKWGGTNWANETQAFTDMILADDGRELRDNQFELLADFPLPDGSTGMVWANSVLINNINLFDLLPSAIRSDPNLISTSAFKIDETDWLVIYEHPPANPEETTTLTFENIPIRANSSLKFGIALSPDVWSEDKGDGVKFMVEVDTGRDKEVVFEQYIDPKNNAADRKVFDYEVSLSKYADSKVHLLFKTQNGTDYGFDHAGWINPTVLTQPGSKK